MTCVYQATATPKYKLLWLGSYLKGEALKVVESLGHSAVAYEATKERLERKYGGKCRQIAINMEEIDQFKSIQPEYARDVEKLADLLDILTINVKEAKRTEELENRSLYLKVQKKLRETMIADYQRWIFEKKTSENLESLCEWLLRETEFLTVASETIKGLIPRSREFYLQTHYGESLGRGNDKIRQKSPVCREEIVSNLENTGLADTLKPIIIFCMTKMKRKKTTIKKTKMNLAVQRMMKEMVLLLLMELIIMNIVTHQ